MNENPELLNSHAIDLASHGEYPEAIACFKQAIIMQKTNYLLWYNLGITYRDSGDISHALFALRQAYELNSGDEDIIETIVVLYFDLGDFERAFQYCAVGMELNSMNPRLWNMTGVLFFSRGEYESACEAFERAVSLDPNYYDALFNLRDTYEELGNKTGAAECASRLKGLPAEGAGYYA